MSDWPEEGIWDQVDTKRIVLATQGVHIWTSGCSFTPEGRTLLVNDADEKTLKNLKKQRRVAFTVTDSSSNITVQGNGLVRAIGETAGSSPTIYLEPYRLAVSSGQDTEPARFYERRVQGWIPVTPVSEPNSHTFDFWYAAFRAVTLPMSALPVVVGAAVALTRGYLDIPLLILCLLGSVLSHAGANAIADYYDLKKGVDLPWALSSHLGALAGERTDPELIRSAGILCFALVGIIGVFLVEATGWPVLIFGVVGVLGGFSYTGGPVSYKYRAMGELWLGVLMGPLTGMGTYYVLAHGWDWVAFFLSTGLGMIVSSVSLVNNLRDLPDDRAANIRTLPMILGINGTKLLYYSLIVGCYVATFIAIALDLQMWPMVIVLLSLPQAINAIRALRSTANDEADIRAKARISPYPLNSIILHKRFAVLSVLGMLIVWLLSVIPGLTALPFKI